uniref:G-protein coupled receptors family 1 profile domain-containing protein n=1 Tax=Poecilia formosa TaxID=48698 RepID=A0A087YGH5_POEFO
MDQPTYLNVIIWFNIRVCLPFTFLLITLCCLVRLDRVPVSYYMNLLLSNLTQLIILIALPPNFPYYWRYWRYSASLIIYACCALASLCFRTMIALERYCSISCPSSSCITQTKGFVIVSVFVWVFCLVFVPLFISLRQKLSCLIFALLPAPVLLTCLVVSLKHVCGTVSVPAEEKCRTVGILVVLLLHYSVAVFPIVISSFVFNNFWSFSPDIYLSLFLLGYFFDLLLFVVMCKGLIEKLLKCLCCCCRMENVERNDGSRSSV